MRRFLWLFIFVPILLLTGCGREPVRSKLTGLTFDRGSGSVWGDQLYLCLTETEILTLRYIPEGSGELKTIERLPVTQEQWQAITGALEQLTLEKEKDSLLGKLFQKQDGGDYRRLTLTYGETSIIYRWPAEGAQLESLLEQLVSEVTG